MSSDREGGRGRAHPVVPLSSMDEKGWTKRARGVRTRALHSTPLSLMAEMTLSTATSRWTWFFLDAGVIRGGNPLHTRGNEGTGSAL